MFDIQKQPGSAELQPTQPTQKMSLMYSPYTTQGIVTSSNNLRMKQDAVKQQARDMMIKIQEQSQLPSYTDLLNK